MDKILIIDGHGLAYRAFYAIPPLNAPDGTPTNAITGFMNMLSRAEEEVSPRGGFRGSLPPLSFNHKSP